MNSTLLDILASAFWCSMASLGFSVLFNTPRKLLPYIILSGFVAGLIKFGILKWGIGAGVVAASMAGAVFVGFTSIFIADWCHVAPTIISIASVISYVPGSFAFKAMMGLLKFGRHTDTDVLVQMVHNATMSFLIILAIALGITLPMLMLRTDSVKNFRFQRQRRK